MKSSDLPEVFRRLRRSSREWILPAIDAMSRGGQTPYRLLIAALLSTRTQDKTTMAAAPRLFALADTPPAMLKRLPSEIERAIYPVAFSRTKARQILQISRILIEQYGGDIPDSLEALDELPGVGRKIANLVMIQALDKPAICVDTHVHRITNRWGFVRSKHADATETVLRRKLPLRYWKEINSLLVALGQKICSPLSPKCSICPVADFCRRVAVRRHR